MAKEKARTKTSDLDLEATLKGIALQGVIKLFNEYQQEAKEKSTKKRTEEE